MNFTNMLHVNVWPFFLIKDYFLSFFPLIIFFLSFPFQIHFAFQKLRSDQLPIGALVETWAFKVLNENFKQCRFTGMPYETERLWCE